MVKNEMFVVAYEYGHYEDYCEVVVGVCTSQERAQEVVDSETALYQGLQAKYDVLRAKMDEWVAVNVRPPYTGFEGERYLAPVKPGEKLSRDEQLLRAEIKQHNQKVVTELQLAWQREYSDVETKLKSELFTEKELELYGLIGEDPSWYWYAVPVL